MCREIDSGRLGGRKATVSCGIRYHRSMAERVKEDHFSIP